MGEKIILEVCVDSTESVRNAVDGGASRIELCANLADDGGVTPPLQLLRDACAYIGDKGVQVFVMVRPRTGDFVYDNSEVSAMEVQIGEFAAEGKAHGFVFGCLTAEGRVDSRACERLLRAAQPFPCTFHRAIDRAADFDAAIEEVSNLGFPRVLTSGGAESAWEGREKLRGIRRNKPELIVVPAGGITAKNVFELARSIDAREIHGSFSQRREGRQVTGLSDVKQVVEILRTMSKTGGPPPNP